MSNKYGRHIAPTGATIFLPSEALPIVKTQIAVVVGIVTSAAYGELFFISAAGDFCTMATERGEYLHFDFCTETPVRNITLSEYLMGISKDARYIDSDLNLLPLVNRFPEYFVAGQLYLEICEYVMVRDERLSIELAKAFSVDLANRKFSVMVGADNIVEIAYTDHDRILAVLRGMREIWTNR